MSEILPWLLALSVISIGIGTVVRLAAKVGLWRQVFLAAILFATFAALGKFFFGLSGDEISYQSEALRIMEQWEFGSTDSSNQPWTKLSLSYLLAIFYYLTFPNMFLGVFLLTPFFCTIPLLTGLASWNFFSNTKIRDVTAWTAVFLPQILLWSPWLLREVLAFFLLALSLYASSLLYRDRLITSAGYFSIALLLMLLVRVQLTWVLLSLFIVSSLFLAWNLKTNRRKLFGVFMATITVMGIFLLTQVVSAPTTGNLISQNSIIFNSELRETVIESNADSTQNLAANIETNQGSGSPAAIRHTIRNLLPSMIGPFPWHWKGLNWMVAGIDGLIMLLIFALALMPFISRRMGGVRVACILWSGALPLILGNSLTLANYGLTMRLRANIALILFPIAVFSAVRLVEMIKHARTHRKSSSPRRSLL